MPLLITSGLGSVGDGSSSALASIAIENFTTYLVVVFNGQLNVFGAGLDPTSYIIAGPGTVKVTSVEVLSPGNKLKLGITPQNASSYTVTLPNAGILDVNGHALYGPFILPFTGISTPVAVNLARSLDERTLDVIFSRAVLAADALDPTKYSISPTVEVKSVSRVTDLFYRLKTKPQDINVNYQVTVSGVRDINGIL